MLKHTPALSQSSLSDVLGLADIRTGKETSDQNLERIFSIASKTGSTARFLRLGGPKRFRSDVMNFTVETGETITSGYRMLLDKGIKDIEFILTNPYSESFLTRVDYEKKSNWEIWRVQEQVLEFARGLLRASEQRERKGLSRIKLAFHCIDLIWNLSIAGDQCVVARAYYKSATGHDENVAEIHLLTGRHSRMAESFISFYNFVKNDPQTRFIHSEDELNSIGNLPSLFKGNSVLNPSDNDPQLIEKSCYSIFGKNAEEKWLSYRESESFSCTYFNPVKLAQRLTRTEPWHGTTLGIHKVEGVSASELLWHIQKIGNKLPELIPKLEILAGYIVFQAFIALTEFREVGKTTNQLKSEMVSYPWEKNLKEALSEAGRFLTDNLQGLSECIEEASKLGRDLEKFATEPFRDSHLKNRMIKIDMKYLTNDYKDFYEFFNEIKEEDIFNWLKENTYDIDFETGFWLVSKWDDPLHILWSNSLGINQADKLKGGFGLLEKWWSPPESDSDENVLWMTLLCRSLREYCRRLWYNHVMPITYLDRYYIEQQNHFLDLAMAAASHLDGYSDIKKFLEGCQKYSEDIWNSAINDEAVEPVVAKVPLFIKEPLVSDHSPNIVTIGQNITRENESPIPEKRGILIDKVEVSGDLVVIDSMKVSIVEKTSFLNTLNKIENSGNRQVVEAINKLANLIESKDFKDKPKTLEHIESLAEEASKSDPKKEKLKSYGEFISNRVSKVSEIAEVANPLIEIISKLWSS